MYLSYINKFACAKVSKYFLKLKFMKKFHFLEEVMAKKRIPHSVDNAEIEKNASGTPRYVFASTLNQLMVEQGIDQEKMAEDLGLSTGIISNYRNGKTEPKLSAIVSIANYLNVDCHYLLTGIKAEYLTIAKETGLSDESITQLGLIHKSYGCNSPETDVLNDLLEDHSIRGLLIQICGFKMQKKSNKKMFDNDVRIIDEVKSGISNGEPYDLLIGKLSTPLAELGNIESSERYQRFLVIDDFTKFLDEKYDTSNYEDVFKMEEEAEALYDFLDSKLSEESKK